MLSREAGLESMFLNFSHCIMYFVNLIISWVFDLWSHGVKIWKQNQWEIIWQGKANINKNILRDPPLVHKFTFLWPDVSSCLPCPFPAYWPEGWSQQLFFTLSAWIGQKEFFFFKSSKRYSIEKDILWEETCFVFSKETKLWSWHWKIWQTCIYVSFQVHRT